MEESEWMELLFLIKYRWTRSWFVSVFFMVCIIHKAEKAQMTHKLVEFWGKLFGEKLLNKNPPHPSERS